MRLLLLSLLLPGPVVATDARAADVPTPEAAARPAPVPIVVRAGYQPDRVTIPADAPATLVFLREDYDGCTREVVFPTLGLRRELPTGVPVVIELPASATGEIPFHCGMHMRHGTVVVEPRRVP